MMRGDASGGDADVSDAGDARDAAATREILVRLIDLTPEPPAGLDAEQLVMAFDEIFAARDEVIAQVMQLAPPAQLADEDRALLVELERRHALWQDALTSAQRTIGQQRRGAEKLRAYAQTP